MAHWQSIVRVLLLFITHVLADFSCICNYNVECAVYASYGYVKVVKDVETQICPGAPPEEDIVTTTKVPTTTPLTTTTKTTQGSPTQTTTNTTTTTTTPIQTSSTPQPSTSTTTTTTALLITTTQTHSTTTTPLQNTYQSTIATANATRSTTPKQATNHGTTHIKTTVTTTANYVVQHTQVQYGCPRQYFQNAQLYHGTLFTLESTCYEIVQTQASWRQAEADCLAKGGHLAHIPDQHHQDVIYQVISQHLGNDVWIGLNDMNEEQQYAWSSGDPVAYTYWASGFENSMFHGIEDCAGLGAKSYHGRWDDIACSSRLNYICEFKSTRTVTFATTTLMPQVFKPDGDIHMCPRSVQEDIRRYNYPLAQHGDSCYELQTQKKIWAHSENICKQLGGHLVTINSASEQAFVDAFMARHNPGNAVWIGLHDRKVEGQFEWTSGEHVTYTNWVPNHMSNYENYLTEDCIALFPYQSDQWDDMPCGEQDSTFGFEIGEKHYTFCEYMYYLVSLFDSDLMTPISTKMMKYHAVVCGTNRISPLKTAMDNNGKSRS
ncbi:macrophage mannose receptor 1-like isoform X2 [Dreissena polymorpha]|uniref:macrophage mannose receptor 1-like isoform X2 n=1 Tax=Dreissena polymorpha TaxID=45954 RepID=UPI0022643E1C|nr:macrophage mannose receptor 1-like isoform X2 [Dreissena polymorpha]